jgi:hypothetical protein
MQTCGRCFAGESPERISFVKRRLLIRPKRELNLRPLRASFDNCVAPSIVGPSDVRHYAPPDLQSKA